MINKILGSSPRATIMGFIQAVLLALVPIIEKNDFNLRKDWIWIALATGRVVAGRIQKDSDGITKQQAKQIAETHEEVKKAVGIETPTNKIAQ